MTDAQLQTRLRHSKFDGAAGGRPKKLLSHVLKLASLMENPDSLAEFEATYTQFLKDMTLFEFNMGRCVLSDAPKPGISDFDGARCLHRIQVVVDTSHRECQAHKELQAALHKDMERTAAEIELLKDRVAQERVIRANKEECAILAKQAEKLPPRSKTEKDKVLHLNALSSIVECIFPR
jgi:hypothetical protein